MMNRLLALAALAIAAVTSACSTTPVGMNYNPAISQAPKGTPSMEVTVVSDKRKHDPNWLGAIRGGFGNPLKTLETPVPVKDVVRGAFTDGLKARNLLTANGRHALELDIEQFDCNQYVRREAHAKIAVNVVERGSGQSVFQRRFEADKVTGDLLALDVGVFASVDDLRMVANDVLQQVIDKALDDPQFRAALR